MRHKSQCQLFDINAPKKLCVYLSVNKKTGLKMYFQRKHDAFYVT